MGTNEERRRALLARTADHLLREGLAGASLRPMAAAAGTSDRMLLYYFSDRDELLRETLNEVAARLTALLDAAGGAARKPFDALLAELRAALDQPALRPYLHLWLEVAASAARGREPFRDIGGRIADGFIAWVADRLDEPCEEDRERRAALLLATLDGLAMLDAVGRGAAADAASAAPRRAIRP